MATREKSQSSSCKSYLLYLVLGDVMQGSVRLQPDPHETLWELRGPHVWLELGRYEDTPPRPVTGCLCGHPTKENYTQPL